MFIEDNRVIDGKYALINQIGAIDGNLKPIKSTRDLLNLIEKGKKG